MRASGCGRGGVVLLGLGGIVPRVRDPARMCGPPSLESGLRLIPSTGVTFFLQILLGLERNLRGNSRQTAESRVFTHAWPGGEQCAAAWWRRRVRSGSRWARTWAGKYHAVESSVQRRTDRYSLDSFVQRKIGLHAERVFLLSRRPIHDCYYKLQSVLP